MWCLTRSSSLLPARRPLDLDTLLDVDPMDVPCLPLPANLSAAAPTAVPPTPSMPRATLSLSPPSARFANPAGVYQRRVQSSAMARSHNESSVYHHVVIHRDPRHVHPMVTRRSAGVLHPIDRLVLTAPAILLITCVILDP